jgi:hypothetical protein
MHNAHVQNVHLLFPFAVKIHPPHPLPPQGEKGDNFYEGAAQKPFRWFTMQNRRPFSGNYWFVGRQTFQKILAGKA